MDFGVRKDRFRTMALVELAPLPAHPLAAKLMRRLLTFLVDDADQTGYVVASYAEIGFACRVSRSTAKRLIRRLATEFHFVRILRYIDLSSKRDFQPLYFRAAAPHRHSACAFTIDIHELESVVDPELLPPYLK